MSVLVVWQLAYMLGKERGGAMFSSIVSTADRAESAEEAKDEDDEEQGAVKEGAVRREEADEEEDEEEEGPKPPALEEFLKSSGVREEVKVRWLEGCRPTAAAITSSTTTFHIVGMV